MPSFESYKNLFDLTGKHALVIGAGSGIGQASAIALAAHGAIVTCADLELERARETSKLILEGGGSSSTAQLDISQAGAATKLISSMDGLDILVCTPSINVRKPLLDISEEEFQRVVDLNLKGSFFTMQAAGKRMLRQNSGSIILFSSIRAHVVEPGQGVYAATKSGTLQMIRALAAELGSKGIRANAIAPGVVETPLTEQIKQQPDWYNAYAARNALGRWSKPQELAGAVVFLASEASSYVTGSLLYVDGGWTAIDGRFTPPL